jgi:putative NADH-flavin reductase
MSAGTDSPKADGSSKRLSVLVIGSTGHGGSYLCLELVNRGHRVTGIARNPSKLGEHPLYTPKSFDVVDSPFLVLVDVLKGFDVVVK